jgi:hypothetical protein
LEKAYHLPIRGDTADALDNGLRQYGWSQINPQQIRPGDVIIAHRQLGDAGEAAIYTANDLVFNNNNLTGRIQRDSAAKFRTGDYVSVKVYHKVR